MKESWYKGKNEEDRDEEEEDTRDMRRSDRGGYVRGIWWKSNGEEKLKGRETLREEERRKNEPEVVVFIPHTPGGVLKERLQEEDTKMVHTLKVRIVKFVEE